MKEISFAERVKETAIREAVNYKNTYVDYEYLVLFEDSIQEYYIISGTEKNYLHLLGVSTLLKPGEFYLKCLNGELSETDFDFVDSKGNDIRGTVRRKIKVLGNMNRLFQQEVLYVQESFVKNRVVCTLGTSDNECTVGFIKSSSRKNAKAFPKTLMKGNELGNAKSVKLLLRRKRGKEKFDEIVIGSRDIIKQYYNDVREMISDELFGKKLYNNRKVCCKKIGV